MAHTGNFLSIPRSNPVRAQVAKAKTSRGWIWPDSGHERQAKRASAPGLHRFLVSSGA